MVLIVLFKYMSTNETGGPANVPPKTSGNRPFPEQARIHENQNYYDDMVLHSRFNFNDWLNLHPGDEKPWGIWRIFDFQKDCRDL